MTIKNQYLFPLVDIIFHRLNGAWVFIKIDMKNAYYRLWMQEGDEWKTAFRTRYGVIEHLVVPFGLKNAPASLQSYIDRLFKPYLQIKVIVYLNDVLLSSCNSSQNKKDFQDVLKAFFKNGLYAKLNKCLFSVTRILFIGFILTDKGVEIEEDCISTIFNHPEIESVCEVESFLGFANFYCRFVKRFSRMEYPLTDIAKWGAEITKTDLHLRKKNLLTSEARISFQDLVATFTNSPFLVHFDAKCLIKLETDASGFAISKILL